MEVTFTVPASPPGARARRHAARETNPAGRRHGARCRNGPHRPALRGRIHRFADGKSRRDSSSAAATTSWSCPGAFTPTEVLTAWEAGADMVEDLPLRHGRARLSQSVAWPAAADSLDADRRRERWTTAADFLKAGAFALGIGSSLVDPRTVAAGDFKSIERLARQFVEIVAAARA